MSAAHSRRRRTLRPWVAHALMAAAGVGLGVGGSVIWPWGFAPAPGTLELVQRPGRAGTVRAERRCGELLARTEKHEGGRPTANRSNDATGSVPTLAQMGLTKDESSRYQQLAACDGHPRTAL